MKALKQWHKRLKENSKEQRHRDIAESFQLKERGETFCIVHNGDAIHDFTPTTTLSEVIRELKKKRETAIRYSGI